MSMEVRDFGFTGLKVSALGLGTGRIGGNELTEKEIEYLLNYAVDNGVNLIDTARSYGEAEIRIGKYLSHRRKDFILSTKVGYDVEGCEDWTYDCVIQGINKALRLLKTDYLDIVHLHSCNKDILEKGEVIEALTRAVQEGKVKVPAYSGDNDALNYAVHSGRFGSIQTSINLYDQRAINDILWNSKQNYMGVIAKRPAANFVWQFKERPSDNYIVTYYDRMHEMNLELGMPIEEASLRFSCFTYGVDSIIVGTKNLEHLKNNIQSVAKGKLHEDLYKMIRDRFKEKDNNWSSLV